MKSPADVVKGDLAATTRHWKAAVLDEDRVAEVACMKRLDVLLDRLNAVQQHRRPTHL